MRAASTQVGCVCSSERSFEEMSGRHILSALKRGVATPAAICDKASLRFSAANTPHHTTLPPPQRFATVYSIAQPRLLATCCLLSIIVAVESVHVARLLRTFLPCTFCPVTIVLSTSARVNRWAVLPRQGWKGLDYMIKNSSGTCHHAIMPSCQYDRIRRPG